MLNSIDYGRSGLPMEMPPGVDPAEFHKQIESARQSQQPPPKPAPTFTGSPTQIASAITNQFIWGQHQAPLPSDGLQQVVDGLSAAVADPNAMTQKMIGLAEAMLRNGPGGGTDGIILDYTAAKLALEVAEQPDSQKHGLSERVTMPDNGQDTYNVVITPGAPGGIGNGYAVLFKKEHGTFLSQVMGAVDNIVTPIVDVAAFFQPELAPLAIGLNVAQGAQDLANGNDLGGALALAGALGGGLSQLGKAGEIASSIGNDGSIIADAAGTGQGISGAIQASQQGNLVAAIASALGGAGNAFAGVDGYLLDQSNTLATPVTNELRLLSRGALTGSALAGVVTAVQGGNVAGALAALTTAAGNAGITPNELLRALLSGGGTATSVNTGIKLAQAEDSENSDAFGLPLNQISQEQITSEYYNLQAKLAAVDPSNPLAAPDLAAPGWQPSANDLAKLQGALEAYSAAPGQSLLPQTQLPNTETPGLTAYGTLSNAENATIDPNKLDGYALNLEHPVGGNKATVFQSALGYNQSNSDGLLQQLQQGLTVYPAIPGVVDQYGSRFTVNIPVTGPNGNTVTVTTGWIYTPGSTTPALTTLFVK